MTGGRPPAATAEAEALIGAASTTSEAPLGAASAASAAEALTAAEASLGVPTSAPAREPPVTRVVILADDLIWATRLASIVRAAGAGPRVANATERFAAALPDADAVLVDLAARRADPFVAIAAAIQAGLPVVAVGAHEDIAARKRALAAGARRVYAYSKLFEDGPRTIAAWLGLPEPTTRRG